ncbi:hypothetical protein MUN89_15820 [Halobacillus salinarum]|uniref:Uncharacterized protein n=1 Tax=Halobacillus salinarum TaxID=2932257 RepID=A0ABY4EH42_9BACI|nr:hypothetical protein [Halobacillus salinarum]UOQ43378.1 hypothetical protein MUN89_15820 [Halobacillus salinarum]
MCQTCHGRGVYYAQTTTAVHVLPCPNETCRKIAQEESAKHIKRIKNALDNQKEAAV